MGARSLKVLAGHCNDTFFWREQPIVSVYRMARRYTIQRSLPNTHTVYIELDGGRQTCRDGGREGARKDDGGCEGGASGVWGGRERGEGVRKR